MIRVEGQTRLKISEESTTFHGSNIATILSYPRISCELTKTTRTEYETELRRGGNLFVSCGGRTDFMED